MEIAQLPLGFQAQVDLGTKTMKDAHGRSIKIFIFAMVLSASRYLNTSFRFIINKKGCQE